MGEFKLKIEKKSLVYLINPNTKNLPMLDSYHAYLYM